ncbi:hypothetical protein HNP84_002418 [Thermocatellispora tengchongensis]|uniref:Uncharacterized protein n=1 Tax=Thermocatellispora tengchongensis TaxID=1073253 RepID=A0A840NZX7_9ACTN|nr:hypothetical protein [Thermocatellispora tengchongensis]
MPMRISERGVEFPRLTLTRESRGYSKGGNPTKSPGLALKSIWFRGQKVINTEF